tara:strand:+ start:5050 stop:5184 length:135 start_codon:yes stop_codon:yes gene_type:complete
VAKQTLDESTGASVLLPKHTILLTGALGFLGLDGKLAFKLADVF